MIYILSFIVVVAVIGLVTAKLNAKAPCAHDWHEHGTQCKCSKCGKTIPNYNYSDSQLTEAA
jgi:hypothetical protein